MFVSERQGDSVEFKDYYKTMGLARTATEAEVKTAYRKLARKFHPDVSKEKDAEARFKDVGEAYEVLKDPEKRAAYDRLGTGPRPGEQFRPPPDFGSGFEFNGAGAGDASASEFFEALFGRGAAAGARGTHGTRFESGPSEDHHARVTLDLEASLTGGERSFTLRVPSLDAAGHLETKERTLSVRIPKGILAGQTIRLAGQGHRGAAQAPAGDLYLEVDFQPHALYRVDGRDLSLTLPVTPWEAGLGASVPVPTPAGTVQMKIPPGTRAGAKLRLKARGIPADPPGDLYAVVDIVLPPADDAKARAAYQAFAAALPFDPRANWGG
jgi:curved DNA-binding protein